MTFSGKVALQGVSGRSPSDRAEGTRGIAAGARVMTLDGEIAVEHLVAGDRIVTRDGMRRLVAVRSSSYSGPAMRLAAGALGHDRPQTGIVLPAETRVHLRDWRAKAMFGAPTADAAVRRLFDGEFVTETRVTDLRVFTLTFDVAQVIYVEGLEIACEAEAVDAEAWLARTAAPRHRAHG
jgi:hypothetical protein